MRSAIFFVICAIFIAQLHAAPSSLKRKNLATIAKINRVRREATEQTDFEKKQENLMKYAVGELLKAIENTVTSKKELFEKIVKKANELETKSDALKEHIGKFQKLIDETNELKDLKEEDRLARLFDLFVKTEDHINYYLEASDEVEEEKILKNLLTEDGAENYSVGLLVEMIKMHDHLENRIGEYIESLTDEEKEKESKLIKWYTDFKKAKGFDNYIELTTQFFDIYDEDD